jgi:hypothetical protein
MHNNETKIDQGNPLAFPGLTKDGFSETVSHNEYFNKLDYEFPELKVIGDTVADYYHLKLFQLRKTTRKREIVQSRQICMNFAKKLTNYSMAKIGAFYGGKDHATVLHAVKTINNVVDTDKNFKSQHDLLYEKVLEELMKWRNSEKPSVLEKGLLRDDKIAIIEHYTDFTYSPEGDTLFEPDTDPERTLNVDKLETVQDVLDFVHEHNREKYQSIGKHNAQVELRKALGYENVR